MTLGSRRCFALAFAAALAGCGSGPAADEPHGCGATPDGGVEPRTRYLAASVPFGQTCQSETQERTCIDGTWTGWTGTYTEPDCFVEGALDCGGEPHGATETRTWYASASVPAGGTCDGELQTRTCDNGAWTGWTGAFTEPVCVVLGYASCDGTPHLGVETRERYEAATVSYGTTCVSETQRRTCADGVWSGWSGTFTQPSCVVLDAASCDSTPHGGTGTRVRYAAAAVPYGTTCESEVQTRACDDGTWSAWSGTFTEEACTVQPPLACGALPHGGSETRTRYETASVPFGLACNGELQTRTCDDGVLSAWSGSFTEPTCVVEAALSCDGTPHGGSETRTRYETASVPYGASCTGETQARTCEDGVWSAWSGTFVEPACSPAAPLDCGATPHGGSETRTMYLEETVGLGGACLSEQQSRTCTNGVLGPWSGTYAFVSCTPLATDSVSFSTYGSRTFTVPAAVTQLLVDLRGAGGARHGGPGGRARSLLAVTAGQTFTVIVGRGGDVNGTRCYDLAATTVTSEGCGGLDLGGRGGWGGWTERDGAVPGNMDGQRGSYAGGAGYGGADRAGGGGATVLHDGVGYPVVAGGGGGGGLDLPTWRGTRGGEGCGGAGGDRSGLGYLGYQPTGGGGGACVGDSTWLGGGSAGAAEYYSNGTDGSAVLSWLR